MEKGWQGAPPIRNVCLAGLKLCSGKQRLRGDVIDVILDDFPLAVEADSLAGGLVQLERGSRVKSCCLEAKIQAANPGVETNCG